jgi:hypothetical protein
MEAGQVNVLTEFNLTVAAMLPPGVWDWLEIIFGGLVVIGTFIQRTCSDRMQHRTSQCLADTVTTYCAQYGIWLFATLALIVFVDGLMPDTAPPRTFVILFLLAYFIVQIRVIYQAVSYRIARYWLGGD